MSVTKAGLLKAAALTLVAGVALALPSGAKADLLGGLSLRLGAFLPSRSEVRDVTDMAVWGGGIEYKVPWFPRLLNGEAWSTSISVDFHYSERKPGIVRVLPVAINQVYTFEERNGIAPYAGFALAAVTFGSTGTGQTVVTDIVTRAVTPSGNQPTVTRFGIGPILGLSFAKNLYWEGRYLWVDKGHASTTPEGFYTYIGYRF